MSTFNDVIEEVQDDSVQNVPLDNLGDGGTNEQLSQLQAIAKMDPSIAEDEEYQNLLAEAQKQGSSKGRNTNVDEDEDEEEDEDDEGEDEDEDAPDVSNPFTSEKGKRKQKEIPVDFEVPGELTDLIKENFGVNNLPTFLNSVQTWRNQAQEVNEVKSWQEAIQADLEAMPYEIKLQIEAWTNGEDPLDAIKNMTRLNFDVEYSNQNVENLVQHYLPEEYDELIKEFNSNEDFTEAELEKQIALLGKTTKRFFEKDKQAVKDQRDNYAKQIADTQKAFKDSALVSVETFSKAYPDFSKTEINKIRKTLVEGELEKLFYNSDGSYTQNAAELVAFALNGKKILEDMESKGERKGMSKASLDIVDKSPKSVKKRSQTNVDKKPDLSVVSHLKGMFGTDPYS